MVDYKGIYHLIATNGFEREYFNFEGKRRFVPKEWVTTSGVKLAYIDALTTMFEEEEFRSSVRDGVKENYKLNIVYVCNGSRAKIERVLDPVYGDSDLAKIAERALKKTGGTYIDLNDDTTRRALLRIFREIQARNSAFTYETINNNLVNLQISDHNKDKIDEFHNNTAYTEREFNRQYILFSQAFKSYKEFRAIYLNYKAYKSNLYKGTEVSKGSNQYTQQAPTVTPVIVQTQENETGKSLVKKKTSKKVQKLQQCEGQLSVFDLL